MKKVLTCAGLVAILVCGQALAVDAGYWRFDNDPGAANGVAGTTAIDECAGNNGTINGGAVYTNQIPPTNWAKIGTAPAKPWYIHHSRNGAAVANNLSLTLSAGQSVTVPHAAALEFAGKPFVIEAYVKVDAPAGTAQSIVEKKNGGIATTDYALLANVGALPASATNVYGKTSGWTGNEIGLLFGNGSGYDMVVSTFEITDANWNFVQVSVNPAKGEVIIIKTRWWASVVDGTYLPKKLPYGEVITGVPAMGQATAGPLTIGSLAGALDEVRIADKAYEGKPATPWYWQFEGAGDVHGVFNELGEQVFCLRQTETNRAQLHGVNDWNPIPGDAANYAHQCNNFGTGADLYKSYWFWEPASADEQVMAENFVSDGATLSMRLKVSAYNSSAGGTRTQKFFRICQGLNGAAPASSEMRFEVGFQGKVLGGAPVLWEALGTASTPPLNDRYHRIWQTAKALPDGTVAIKAWCDGAKFVDYVKTAAATVSYYGPNNNSINSAADTLVDYMRFAEKAYSFADLNFDGSVDGADYGLFAGCFNGTGNPIAAGCDSSDFDGDGSVDGADFGLFAGCFNGTGNPTPCF